MECLREVEKYCPNNEEFRQLCALLTLPRLTDHQDFKFWNPSSARVDCFNKILPLVMEFIGSLKEEKSGEFGLATNDRFLQVYVYPKILNFRFWIPSCRGWEFTFFFIIRNFLLD